MVRNSNRIHWKLYLTYPWKLAFFKEKKIIQLVHSRFQTGITFIFLFLKYCHVTGAFRTGEYWALKAEEANSPLPMSFFNVLFCMWSNSKSRCSLKNKQKSQTHIRHRQKSVRVCTLVSTVLFPFEEWLPQNSHI